MQKLAGRTAIITGASSGIGRGIALELAKAGARTVLAARNEAALAELAGEIADLGSEAWQYVPMSRGKPISSRCLQPARRDSGHRTYSSTMPAWPTRRRPTS